jgi:hypothetical protein
MTWRKIKVNTSPVADGFGADNERIIEFSSANGGGLISFKMIEGRLVVDVYRTDDTVDVRRAPVDPFTKIVTVEGRDLDSLRGELSNLADARTVRFVIDGGIKIKVDGGMWSPPLGELPKES